MTEIERLIELEAIYRVKARRDHALDQRDWVTFAELHTEDILALSIGPDHFVGGKAAADRLSVVLENVTMVHHRHTPVIEFQDRGQASRIWAMEDRPFWKVYGAKQWLRGFGYCHENYVQHEVGKWRISSRRLQPLVDQSLRHYGAGAERWRNGRNPVAERDNRGLWPFRWKTAPKRSGHEPRPGRVRDPRRNGSNINELLSWDDDPDTYHGMAGMSAVLVAISAMSR